MRAWLERGRRGNTRNRHVGGARRDRAAESARAPILTFADAFAALGYLSAHPNVAPGRIGVLGFRGGVVSLAAAETLYATNFGKGSTSPPTLPTTRCATGPTR